MKLNVSPNSQILLRFGRITLSFAFIFFCFFLLFSNLVIVLIVVDVRILIIQRIHNHSRRCSRALAISHALAVGTSQARRRIRRRNLLLMLLLMRHAVRRRRPKRQRQLPHVAQQVAVVAAPEHDHHLAFPHERRVPPAVRRRARGEILAGAAPADEPARRQPRRRHHAQRRVGRVAPHAAAKDNDDVDRLLRRDQPRRARRDVAHLRRARRRRDAPARLRVADVAEAVPLLRARVQRVGVLVVLADGRAGDDDDELVRWVGAVGDDGGGVAADGGAAGDLGRAGEIGR